MGRGGADAGGDGFETLTYRDYKCGGEGRAVDPFPRKVLGLQPVMGRGLEEVRGKH